MPLTYTTNTALAYNALNDTGWNTTINADWTLLDGLTALGALCATTNEHPSTSLNVKVSSGVYRNGSGLPTSYAGGTILVTASATTLIWLTDAGVLTVGSSWPTTAHVRIASVVAGASSITSVTDARIQCDSCGTGLGFVLKSGDTIADGANFALGTTTGTQIGTAATQKLGFYGTPAVAQASSTTDLRQALINVGLVATGGASPLNLNGGALTVGSAAIVDSGNVVLGTTTGTQIGTSATQKLGFYGAPAVVQASSTTDLRQVLINVGLVATGGASPLNLNGGALTVGSAAIADGGNVILGTTTGTQIGTAATQKLGFYGAPAVVQQTGGAATAGTTYGTNEQGMLQRSYNALRALGLLN